MRPHTVRELINSVKEGNGPKIMPTIFGYLD